MFVCGDGFALLNICQTDQCFPTLMSAYVYHSDFVQRLDGYATAIFQVPSVMVRTCTVVQLRVI